MAKRFFLCVAVAALALPPACSHTGNQPTNPSTFNTPSPSASDADPTATDQSWITHPEDETNYGTKNPFSGDL